MSRLLSDLDIDVRVLAEKLILKCQEADQPIRITQTQRTFEEQQELYVSRPKVTNAPPGYSWHNWRRAFDFCFTGNDPYGEHHPWEMVGNFGEELGLIWGGRWKHADRPHFELPGKLSMAALRAKFPKGYEAQL